jgi:tRNA-splicing ligase RtcB (3'-phosphate/5'-hydroxy nucleic acid ligase)
VVVHGVGSTTAGGLCADEQVGFAEPVGGVIAYDDISISGVDFDIGCGNMAVRTDMTLSDVALHLDKVCRDIARDMGRLERRQIIHAQSG